MFRQDETSWGLSTCQLLTYILKQNKKNNILVSCNALFFFFLSSLDFGEAASDLCTDRL